MCNVCGSTNHRPTLRGNAAFRANAWIDPSRTTLIRRRFMAAMGKRFRELRADITTSIVQNNALGIRTNAPAQPGEFDFPTDEARLNAFKAWLRRQIDTGILERVQGGRRWTDTYVRAAYNRGVERAKAELIKAGVSSAEATATAGVFQAPIHSETLAFLYTRAFDELEGITQAMSQQINRVLAEGMANGDHPSVIARAMRDRVDKVGITRARTLARTEIIKAHHRANVAEYERAGLQGVKIRAEWDAAGDACPICSALDGKTYGIQEVKGMLPAHPNCRCVALPVVS